jgi:hypothetical protein
MAGESSRKKRKTDKGKAVEERYHIVTLRIEGWMWGSPPGFRSTRSKCTKAEAQDDAADMALR